MAIVGFHGVSVNMEGCDIGRYDSVYPNRYLWSLRFDGKSNAASTVVFVDLGEFGDSQIASSIVWDRASFDDSDTESTGVRRVAAARFTECAWIVYLNAPTFRDIVGIAAAQIDT